jgi:hypothetical protein
MASGAGEQSALCQRGICDRWRAILATYIISAAKAGERDTRRLADSALLYLSRQKLNRTPPTALPNIGTCPHCCSHATAIGIAGNDCASLTARCRIGTPVFSAWF